MSGMRLFRETDALIVVDVQPTFMPGGGLAVEGGDEVVPIVQRLIPLFDQERRFATLDRHPRGHISLASSYVGIPPMSLMTPELMMDRLRTDGCLAMDSAQFSVKDLESYLVQVGSQVLWPDHAIAGTAEAELHPDLRDIDFAFTQVKGMDPTCDSYSGFYDNLRRRTGLDGVVSNSGSRRIFICGLAFDFCVGWTALDARKALPQASVFVIEDACRSVNMPGSVDAMKTALDAAGVQRITSDFWQ